MLRQTIAALVFTLAAAAAGANDDPQAVPKGLVDYIRSAKTAGLPDSDIQKNAAQAGWQPADIAKAMAGAGAPAKAAPRANGKESPPAPPARRPAGEVPGHGVDDDYRIGAGDIIQISVWKEPDASVASTVVRPDGKISMPLLKDVSVVGLKPRDAEERIAELLAKYINDPDVTVVVNEINSKKVYVVGAVKKEGPLPYTYRMTVIQALSEAGGLTDYAKRKKIYVLRNENGRDFRLPFDYDAVLRGERMELNIALLPGDTLVVPH
jgi:polysaccharide export outer membrane protein